MEKEVLTQVLVAPGATRGSTADLAPDRTEVAAKPCGCHACEHPAFMALHGCLAAPCIPGDGLHEAVVTARSVQRVHGIVHTVHSMRKP